MRKIRKITKLFTFIMALAVLCASLPISSIAMGMENEEASVAQDELGSGYTPSAEGESNEVEVIREREELREENVKHFLLSDGTTKAVLYGQSVHYMDENGKWIDIDNSLKLNGNEYSATNKQSVSFANKSGSSGLVSIKDGEYKIDFTQINANKVQVEITNPVSSNSRKFEDLAQLNNLTSRAVYNGIYDGVDIEYILVGNSLKENIIVKERAQSYSYSVEIKLSKLSATLEDNSIYLTDSNTGECMYVIPAPYMLDASGEYSEAVTYSLVQNSEWKYTLTVTASAEWINAEGRAFPVTIDPTVGTSIVDATLLGKEAFLTVSMAYAVLEIDEIPELPNNAYITNASLSLFSNIESDCYIGTKANVLSEPTDCHLVDDIMTQYEWDITEIANEWYTTQSDDYLVYIASIEGTGETRFYRNSVVFLDCLPQICITYRDMKGVEAYWQYISQNAGLAGGGGVNLATGGLSFAVSTLSTTDSLFGFTPSLIYNSEMAGLDYINVNAQIAYRGAYTPKGFKFNGHETIIRCTYGLTDTQYIWIDADGTEHSFYQTETEGVYKDEDGLQLELKVVSENELHITDSNYTVRKFSHLQVTLLENVERAWFLTSVEDKNGNALTLTVDEQKKPTAIKVTPNGLAPIEMLVMGYASSSLMTVVWNQASGQAALFRYSSTYNGATVGETGTYLREALFVQCDSTVTMDALKSFVNDIDNTADGITVYGIAKYEYDSTGKLTTVTDVTSGYKLVYGYTGSKVTSITEYGNGNVAGQTVGISYYSGYTEVRGAGTDDLYGNSDDLITVYDFDNWGRAISVYTMDMTRSVIYGATTGEYESEVENAKNSLSVSTVVNSNSTNYVMNGNFESSDTEALYWNKSGNVSFVKSSSAVDFDNGYVNLSVGSTVTVSFINQDVNLAKGTYTVNMELTADVLADIVIKLRAVSDDGYVVKSVPTNELTAAGGKYYASMTFEITSATTPCSIGVVLEAGEGLTSNASLRVDNIMVSKGTGVAPYNNVCGADFEDFETTLTGEIGKWTLNDGTISTAANFGNSLRIDGSITSKKEASQKIYEASNTVLSNYIYSGLGAGTTSADTVFVLSGFGMATNVLYNDSSRFAIGLRITTCTLEDISSVENIVTNTVTEYAYFNKDNRNWQFASLTYTLPKYSMVKSIEVVCEYTNNVGTAYFDNITLTYGEDNYATTYEYYDSGKVKAKLSGSVNNEFYTYDENGNLTNVISNRRLIQNYYADNNLIKTEIYSHTYIPSRNDDAETLLTRLETRKKLKSTTHYEYDVYGFVVRETTYDKENAEYIENTYTYDNASGSKIFGAIKQSTDTFGKTTYYFYDEKGQLLSIIEPDNYGYIYSYDNIGRLTGVQPAKYITELQTVNGMAVVNYVYDSSSRLSKIKLGTQEYTFTYDEFGNQAAVYVGNSLESVQLVSQETNENNGKVSSVTYADGTIIEYEYDILDRICQISYNKGTEEIIYTYEYDANGNICRLTDSESKTSTVYEYDNAGRLARIVESSTETLSNQYRISYSYDSESRLKNEFYYIDYLSSSSTHNYVMYHTIYVYNSDSTLRAVSITAGGYSLDVDYTYDSFGRVSTATNTMGSVSSTAEYGYLTDILQTSFVVSSYTTTIGSVTNELLYTYDDKTHRNITEISDSNNAILYRYEYDILDRLVREDNSITGKTYVYTYDNNGNILSEKIYSYTLGDVSALTPITTNTYGYTNNVWKDQLTSYNGASITYDSVGNPLSYYNGMSFTWGNVNNLTAITQGSNSYTYTYNDSDIRTSKTVNGVTHRYYLNGSQIVAETYGDVLILYFYDATGGIVGMAYRNSTYAANAFDKYLFVKNLQGDVTDIYDSTGTCVASYTYNAWGEHTVTNYTTANIGNLNPFRYRGYYFDTETGFYYLNARYYDPQTKRFINADHINYLGANGDMTAFNLYAYCSNNPVVFVDVTGNRISYFLNKDGSYSLHDNDRFEDKTSFHDQILAVKIAGFNVDPKESTIMLGSVELDAVTAGWEWEYVDLSLFDFGHAEIKFEIVEGQLEIGAMASVWSPSISFSIGDAKIGLGLEIGAVGGKFSIGPSGFHFSIAWGAGFTVEVDWD